MLLIKKRVSLDFLGDEYKDSYLTFRAMPIVDYEASIPESEKAIKDKKALSFMLNKVQEYFLEGRCLNEKGENAEVTKDDLKTLDSAVAERCFIKLTGQSFLDEEAGIASDLKADSPNQSSTIPPNPPN